jgi:hypothetical protein
VGSLADLIVGAFADLMVGALVDFTVGALVDFTEGALTDFIAGALAAFGASSRRSQRHSLLSVLPGLHANVGLLGIPQSLSFVHDGGDATTLTMVAMRAIIVILIPDFIVLLVL